MNRWWSVAVLSGVIAACGGDDGETPAPTPDVEDDAGADGSAVPDTTDEDGSATDTETDATPPGPVLPADWNPDCDPLDTRLCALPWPSNLYLEEDAARPTGYTLAFGDTTLPANFQRVHVGGEQFRRMDGFSVGTPLITYWPGIEASNLATDRSIEQSMEDDAPVVWFEDTGAGLVRIPWFAELDAVELAPENRVLWVRPAVLLKENTRYVVAFRGMVNATGERLPSSPAFTALRDGVAGGDPFLQPRVDRFEAVFDDLEGAGVERESLQLAWDFHTASSEALHGRMLHIREEALAAQPEGPEIVVTSGWDTPNTVEEDPYWAYVLRGYIEVPDYMQPSVQGEGVNEVTGYEFNYGDDGLPEPFGTRQAEFWIGIPHSALDGTPHGLMQYGHGFFGLGDEVVGSWTANGRIANEHKFIFFGGNWTGMAEEDFAGASFLIFDLNYFRWLPDRSHQGMLEFILFARAMKERFAEFEQIDELGLTLASDELVYMGISQGGIYGGTYMALAPDITRGHLGVPGQNYSLLEHRSTNFEDFFTGLSAAYRGRDNQAVLLSAVQILWDTIDPVSYLRHITAEPFEGDPTRYVLMAPSKGDVQVTTLSVEVVAMSDVGIEVMANYDDEREVAFVTETSYPYTGSGIVLYDYGPEWPAESTNLPPGGYAIDVHEAPRFNDAHNRQLATFLRTGEIVDVCGGDGCTPSCEPGECRRVQTEP